MFVVEYDGGIQGIVKPPDWMVCVDCAIIQVGIARIPARAIISVCFFIFVLFCFFCCITGTKMLPEAGSRQSPECGNEHVRCRTVAHLIKALERTISGCSH